MDGFKIIEWEWKVFSYQKYKYSINKYILDGILKIFVFHEIDTASNKCSFIKFQIKWELQKLKR